VNPNYILIVIGVAVLALSAVIIKAGKSSHARYRNLKWFQLPGKFWEQTFLEMDVMASGVGLVCFGLDPTYGLFFAVIGAYVFMLAGAALVFWLLMKISDM
jgi:hypothetical protein